MELRKHFMQLGRKRIAYFKEGSGEPLIMVHGFPTSSHLFRKVIPGLSEHFTVYAPDLMGYGDTEVSEHKNLNLSSQTDMLIEFMDAEGLERVNFFGHDLGGGIAQILSVKRAAHHPRQSGFLR